MTVKVQYIQGDLGKIYIMGDNLYQVKFNNSNRFVPFYTKDLPYWLNEIEAHGTNGMKMSAFPGTSIINDPAIDVLNGTYQSLPDEE